MNATQIKFRYKGNEWAAALDAMGNLTVTSTNGEGQNHAVGAFHKACEILSVFNESDDPSRPYHHSCAFVSGSVVPAVFVVVDDENAAETFWENFREIMPAWAKVFSDTDSGEAVRIPVRDWQKIQAIEGFADGPEFARTAIAIAEAGE